MKYACCLHCATILLQAETIQNAVVKCPKCNNRYIIQATETDITIQNLNEHTTHKGTQNGVPFLQNKS